MDIDCLIYDILSVNNEKPNLVLRRKTRNRASFAQNYLCTVKVIRKKNIDL